MKLSFLLLLLLCVLGCAPEEHSHEREDELSLFNEDTGLNLPEEMKRELGVEVMTLSENMRVPDSALIRGVREDFVYVQKEQHFLRAPVAIGAMADGSFTITNGLSIGDQVVVRAAKDLWMIELLAVRGGEPCCPVGDKHD